MSGAAAFFDVDGTLADTESAHLHAFNAAFAEAGLDWHWDEALYSRLLAVAGGKDGAFQVMNGFRLIAISNNLGDSKSLATHPATTTHMRIGEEERARLGITDGVIRVSIGLEDPEDLKEDLRQALALLATEASPQAAA